MFWRRSLYIFFSIFLLVNIVSAQETTCNDGAGPVHVFFGNGVFNTKITTGIAQIEVATRISDNLPESEQVEYIFGVAFNEREAYIGDVLEAVRQRATDAAASFIRWLSGLEIAPK